MTPARFAPRLTGRTTSRSPARPRTWPARGSLQHAAAAPGLERAATSARCSNRRSSTCGRGPRSPRSSARSTSDCWRRRAP